MCKAGSSKDVKKDAIRKLERRERKEEVCERDRERSQRNVKHLLEVRFSDRSFQLAIRLQAGAQNRKGLIAEVGQWSSCSPACIMMGKEEMFSLRVEDKRICKGM